MDKWSRILETGPGTLAELNAMAYAIRPGLAKVEPEYKWTTYCYPGALDDRVATGQKIDWDKLPEPPRLEVPRERCVMTPIPESQDRAAAFITEPGLVPEGFE